MTAIAMTRLHVNDSFPIFHTMHDQLIAFLSTFSSLSTPQINGGGVCLAIGQMAYALVIGNDRG